MKHNQVITKAFICVAAMVAYFSITPVQAATVEIPAQEAPAVQQVAIEGVIVSLDGDNLLLRSGATNTPVTLSKATKIESVKTFLIFPITDPASTADLIPGLRVNIEAEVAGKQTTAKGIKFDVDDLKRAHEMQAALAVPQQQIAANKEQNQVQEQQITANKEQNEKQDAEAKAEREAIEKRFGDLADYDNKGETAVLFDINSAKLSDKAKEDVCAIAATAKTFKGYLIQVVGHASAPGDVERNQALSDRRAAAVTTYLQQSCDVAISRVLTPVALGESKPVAANETAQGRAENRRVTLKILVNRGIAQ